MIETVVSNLLLSKRDETRNGETTDEKITELIKSLKETTQDIANSHTALEEILYKELNATSLLISANNDEIKTTLHALPNYIMVTMAFYKAIMNTVSALSGLEEACRKG